jgi:hypothetical protein
MREDFNKLLTERERHGHKSRFRPTRHLKAFKPDEELSAGRESMKKRYGRAHGGDRKEFNENLNPLRNYIRCNVGRPWDSVYSEICQNFDKRKVINNHILEHLFQYVTIKLQYRDGVLCELQTSWRSGDGWVPVKESRWIEWYVDPADGILKENKHRKTYKQREAEGAAERLIERDKVYRKIDDSNHLFLVKGLWFNFKSKPHPPKVEEWTAPPGLLNTWESKGEWARMEAHDKRDLGGKMQLVDAPRPDEIFPPYVSGLPNKSAVRRSPYRVEHVVNFQGRYFYEKKQASAKELKAAGIVALVPFDDDLVMSHRQRSKHGIKEIF